jgi:hypothetical protein
MKKIFIIFLLSIYAFATFGIVVKQFYCCGKLASTSISLVETGKGKCGMGDESSGCCKTTFKSLKVKDTHLQSDAVTLPAKWFSEVVILNKDVSVLHLVQHPIGVNNPGHAPPQPEPVPLYITNCIYRI